MSLLPATPFPLREHLWTGIMQSLCCRGNMSSNFTKKKQRRGCRRSQKRECPALRAQQSWLPSAAEHTPCAVLPTATPGKIIRKLADILSIFLPWLGERSAWPDTFSEMMQIFFYFFGGGLPGRKSKRRGNKGGKRSLQMQSSSLKSNTKHLSVGRDAANQRWWFVQHRKNRERKRRCAAGL